MSSLGPRRFYISDTERTRRRGGDGEDQRMITGGEETPRVSCFLFLLLCCVMKRETSHPAPGTKVKHKPFGLFMCVLLQRSTLVSCRCQMPTCPLQGDACTSLCKQTIDSLSAMVLSVCLWACIWSAHESLSVSICCWAFSSSATLTADLNPSHPEPLHRAERHIRGPSDVVRLERRTLSKLVEQTRGAGIRLVRFDLFSCYSGEYKWVHTSRWMRGAGWQKLQLTPLLSGDREAKRTETWTGEWEGETGHPETVSTRSRNVPGAAPGVQGSVWVPQSKDMQTGVSFIPDSKSTGGVCLCILAQP